MSKGLSPAKPAKISRRTSSLWLVYSAIALAVVVRIVFLINREFWYDEVLSLLLSTGQKVAYSHPPDSPILLSKYTALLQLPPENGIGDSLATWEALLKGLVAEPHPPLFFLSQHLWLRIFGNSVAAVRSLGVLLSLLAIAFAYNLGRCLMGHRGGLIFAALLGLNPFYLFHALNVRMYGSLVLWTILSAWSLLEIIAAKSKQKTRQSFWSIVFIASITAGLMTFYYFAFWLVALAAVVLLLDRRHWWQHALRMTAGVLITTPWVLWGTRQQLNNADLGRFAASSSWLEAAQRHLEGVIQTLGIQLVLGDWISSLPPVTATLAGISAVALLLYCSYSLWRQGQRRVLGIALLLGIFPLLLMLAVDIVTGKFTVGFGWGRSVIFVLPGCLLLIAIWLERAAGKWRQPAIAFLLLLYLSISVSDFTGRSRWMFHELAAIIEQEPTTPTLIALNSRAWGHVMRLAYYLPPEAPLSLLAQNPADLAPALQQTLSQPGQYPRLIWLHSADPVWSVPKTETQKLIVKQEIQTVIDSRYRLEKIQPLSGTMPIDNFVAHIYQLPASSDSNTHEF